MDSNYTQGSQIYWELCRPDETIIAEPVGKVGGRIEEAHGDLFGCR